MTVSVARSFIITPQGILSVQGGAEALAALRSFADDVVSEASRLWETKENAQALTDSMQAWLSENGALGALEVAGATAFSSGVGAAAGTLITATTLPFLGPGSVAVGVAGGIAAGMRAEKLYKDAFEIAQNIGTEAGRAAYELGHDQGNVPRSRRRFEEICRNPNFPQQSSPTYRVVYVDPLAIDLDGDGVETVATNGLSGALFDGNADGVRTATGWLSGDDAWLIRDLNGDGIINNGTELFGDQTQLPNGQKAANGIAALSALDANADGKIDASDAAFNELRLWQDANGNGVTDAGELKTLESLGLQSISAQSSNPGAAGITATAAGSYANSQVVTVTRTDGSTTIATDLNLTQDSFNSQYIDQIDIPEALRSLPDLAGMGRLRNLKQAAALSPALATALTAYANAQTREAQKSLLGDVIYEWAKTDPKFNPNVYENLTSWGVHDAESTNVIYVRRSQAASAAPFLQPGLSTLAPAEFAKQVRIMDAMRGQRPRKNRKQDFRT